MRSIFARFEGMVIAVSETNAANHGRADRKVDVKQINRAITAMMLTIGMTCVPVVPAMAQQDQDQRDQHRQDDRRSRDDDRNRQNDRREWRRYDHNHFEPGQPVYDPARYYRDGSYYRARRLGRSDRIYRGTDDRYYCRRSDGTTGLIVGGITGGVLGNVIAQGDSRTLGTIIGAGAGAAVGRSIDRNNVTCR
jgi:hypothetical protein